MIFIVVFGNVLMPEETRYEDDLEAEAYRAGVPWQTIPPAFTIINHQCINQSIVNEGSCGSCWAASVASAQTMRRCLKGDPEMLSIEEHVSCDHVYTSGVTNNGCWGGNPIPALKYSESTGDVYEKCYRYHHFNVYYPYPPTTCQTRCDDGSTKRRLKSRNAHRVYGEDEIKQEILNNGPVIASIDLYTDFPPKDKLVPYQVTNTSKKQGGHAVIIVGWGTYNGVPYWDVANTYGKTWNKDGKARIRRGYNDMRIESYMTAAEVVVENMDGSVPEVPPANPEPDKPKFSFINNWVYGQLASVRYTDFPSCSLYTDAALIANISGSGEINIYVSLAEGTHNLTCGSVTGTFTVVNYTPQFTVTDYTAEEGEYIAFRTTTRSGITQNIYYDNKNFTVSATTTSVKAVLNRNTAYLYTTNTNPIVKANVHVSVVKAEIDDGSVFFFVNEPLQQYKKGEAIKVSVRQEFIFTVTASLTAENGTVVQTLRWQNPDNIKYLSTFYITFNNAPEGEFEIVLKADTGKTIRSEYFTVGTAEKTCSILKPENNSEIFEKKDFLLVTENCEGEVLYINNGKIGTIETAEQLITNNFAAGALAVKVNESELEFQVIKLMEFEQATYTGAVNESIRIKVNNLPARYTVEATIKYSFSNGYFVVVSDEPGQFQLQVTSEGVIPNMVISAEVLVVGSCQLEFDTKQTYFVGDTYELSSSYCTGNYQVYEPSGAVVSTTGEFKPELAGDYKICIENECSGTFYVYGVKVDLLTAKLKELTDPISIEYAAGQQTKHVVVQLLCKEHEQAISLVVVPNDPRATEQVVKVHIPEIGCRNAKFKVLDVDNQKVYGATGTYLQVEEYPRQFE